MNYIIEEFNISNFRSISNLSVKPNENGLVTICGANNVGKTNFLRALNLFFNPKLENFEPNNDIPFHIVEGSRGGGFKTTLKIRLKDKRNNDIYKITQIFSRTKGEKTLIIDGTKNNIKLIEKDIYTFLEKNFTFFLVEASNIDIPKLISEIVNEDILPIALDKRRGQAQQDSLNKLEDFISKSKEVVSKIENELTAIFKDIDLNDGHGDLSTVPVLPEDIEENPLDCITKEKLSEIFPTSSLENRTKLADNIRIYGGYFGINTKEEVCHFLAQVGAETGGLSTLNAIENLNYTTASRLVEIFPSKFSLITHPTKVNPIPYLNNPSGLANLVYCCQYGNGDVASGDGWKYRGRGVLQLTWKGNYLGYENYLNDIGLDWFYYEPDNLSDANGIHSVLSGMWFFKKNVLDKMTINSTTSVKKVTKKINPALKKLNERKNYFNKAIDVLNC